MRTQLPPQDLARDERFHRISTTDRFNDLRPNGLSQAGRMDPESHESFDRARRQMHGGFGAMLSFQVRGGREAALAVAAKVAVFTRATSLGGIESLVAHPASMTHASIPKDAREAAAKGCDVFLMWPDKKETIAAIIADEAAIGMIVTGDVLIHTWDLARSTGQDETLDPTLVAEMWVGMQPMDEMLRASGHYGPRVDAPDTADVGCGLSFGGISPSSICSCTFSQTSASFITSSMECFLSFQSFRLIKAVPEFAPVPSVKISNPAVVDTDSISSMLLATF